MMAVKLIKEGLSNSSTGTYWIACIHMTTTQSQNYKTNTRKHSFVLLPGTNHSKSPPSDSPICTLSQCWRQFLVALNIWMALYLLCNAMALLWYEMRFFVINTVYVACFRLHVDNGHNEWIITKGMKIKLLYQQVPRQRKLKINPLLETHTALLWQRLACINTTVGRTTAIIGRIFRFMYEQLLSTSSTESAW